MALMRIFMQVKNVLLIFIFHMQCVGMVSKADCKTNFNISNQFLYIFSDFINLKLLEHSVLKFNQNVYFPSKLNCFTKIVNKVVSWRHFILLNDAFKYFFFLIYFFEYFFEDCLIVLIRTV